MRVHSPTSHAALAALPVSATYNAMRHAISGLDGPEALGLGDEWGNGEATFGHLMAATTPATTAT